eukprot:2434059-Alexandrium_andersonii.AAC.1
MGACDDRSCDLLALVVLGWGPPPARPAVMGVGRGGGPRGFCGGGSPCPVPRPPFLPLFLGA